MSDRITVNVRLFATLKERAGVEQHTMQLNKGATVAEFKQQLSEEFPGLPKESSGMLVAVSQEYAFDEELIPPDVEIAVFPPVSGG